MSKLRYGGVDNESGSSTDSSEERRGFEWQSFYSHWDMANDAEEFGFIPVNEKEEYDYAVSRMLHEAKRAKPEFAAKRSMSSKISSLFKHGGSKSKKDKKPKRRDSKLLSLLRSDSKDRESRESSRNSRDRLSGDSAANEDANRFKYQQVGAGDVDILYDEDEAADTEEDDERESATKKKRKRKRPRRKKKKGPAVASMNAPRPRPMEQPLAAPSSRVRRAKKQADVKKKKSFVAKRKRRGKETKDSGKRLQIELETRKPTKGKGGKLKGAASRSKGQAKSEKKQYSQSEKAAGELLAVHLSAHRKHTQFNTLLKMVRDNRDTIGSKPKLLQRFVDKMAANGDTSFVGSKKIVKRAKKMIKLGHPLFDQMDYGQDDEKEAKGVRGLLRRRNEGRNVFSGLTDTAMLELDNMRYDGEYEYLGYVS